jgi:hypothetical protein
MKEAKQGMFKGPDNPFFGKRHTLENRSSMSQKATNRPVSNNHVAVVLQDLNHNTIKEFLSMTALGEFLKADRQRLAKYRESGEPFRGLYYITRKNK